MSVLGRAAVHEFSTCTDTGNPGFDETQQNESHTSPHRTSTIHHFYTYRVFSWLFHALVVPDHCIHMYKQSHHPGQKQYVSVHILHLWPFYWGKSHFFWVLKQSLHQFHPIQAVQKMHCPSTTCLHLFLSEIFQLHFSRIFLLRSC